MKLPRMYTEFASWWPLISAPQESAEESQFYQEMLVKACKIQPNTMLELGCGGGKQRLPPEVLFRYDIGRPIARHADCEPGA